MTERYKNEQTGAEVHLGRTGSGFYVEATHPEYSLPLRKTYEWYEQDLATRDFDLLRKATGAFIDIRRSA
jgi:hypothetical protein